MYRELAKTDSGPLKAEDLRPTPEYKKNLKKKKKAYYFMQRVILHRQNEREKAEAEKWDATEHWHNDVEPILIENFQRGIFQTLLRSQIRDLNKYKVEKLFSYARSLGYLIKKNSNINQTK